MKCRLEHAKALACPRVSAGKAHPCFLVGLCLVSNCLEYALQNSVVADVVISDGSCLGSRQLALCTLAAKQVDQPADASKAASGRKGALESTLSQMPGIRPTTMGGRLSILEQNLTEDKDVEHGA